MKRLLPKSAFGCNVLTLSLGTMVAQAIPILISPLLTRIYSPTEFGLFTLYISAIGLLGSSASFRYELAIILPKEEEKSFNLVFLSIMLSITTSILFFLLILVAEKEINNLLGENQMGNYLYLLPLGMILLSTHTTLTFWLNRQQLYAAISKNRILQSLISNSYASISGVLKLSINGLVIGHILSYILTTLFAWKIFLKKFKKNTITRNQLKKVINEYIHHPRDLFPAYFIGIIGMQLPIFFIGSHYGLVIAGLYALANRIVAVPTLLIANAISDVYKQQASATYSEINKFDHMFLITLSKSIKIAVIPFLLIFLTAPYFFPFLFGTDWGHAGEYARVLAVQTFINFIQNTIDAGSLIVKASKYIFLWHLIRTMSYIILINITIVNQLPFFEYLIYQAIINSFFYGIDILNQYKFSKGKF